MFHLYSYSEIITSISLKKWKQAQETVLSGQHKSTTQSHVPPCGPLSLLQSHSHFTAQKHWSHQQMASTLNGKLSLHPHLSWPLSALDPDGHHPLWWTAPSSPGQSNIILFLGLSVIGFTCSISFLAVPYLYTPRRLLSSHVKVPCPQI